MLVQLNVVPGVARRATTAWAVLGSGAGAKVAAEVPKPELGEDLALLRLVFGFGILWERRVERA